ncbi:hypothetical protein AC579_8460 [Pseudocercospora musae]|uniref:3-hydroxyisobutyrate dehydrogenase n=1 Tax=Pseudocercospora musae TaxID=113226 RepID=A0A139I2V5_9PEZI|nr:hypothetical protein AC579_8460 [Pseudocercospora musae]
MTMAEKLPKTIGWVGLGLMGYPMAQNLVGKMDSDTHFYVFDVVEENVSKLVNEDEKRVHACRSSKEVADRSDLILSMVPEGSHVKAVYLEDGKGVLASGLGKKILIDCSTIDTASSLAVRDACAERHPQASFYDAPVSGGVIGAEKGSLTFMVGCAEGDVNKPLLESILGLMGGNIFACGGASLGLVSKLCNNYCSGLIAIAVSEALNIGIRSGMDPRVLANIWHTSTAQSSICDDWNPVPGLCPDAPASKGYKGGFRVQLMKKDFGLAVDTAERVGARLALGKEGLAVYAGASQAENCKDLDSRVVYRYLQGVEDWNKDKRFAEKIPMKKDETRRLLKKAREIEALPEQK